MVSAGGRVWSANAQWVMLLVVALVAAGAAAYAAWTGWVPRERPRQGELVRVSEFRGYSVELLPSTSPVEVNRLETWTIRVRDRDDRPVTGARVEFDGRMPAHGHGLPTEPRVTGEVAPGDYRVEGIRFSMPGEWQLRVVVSTNGGSDTVVYDLPLETAPVR